LAESDGRGAADELAVRNVIALYGLAADCGDIETALRCHTEDAVYIVSNPKAGRSPAEIGAPEADDLELSGHEAIAQMLGSQMHQSLLPNCAHTVGPLVVKVQGREARVLGYSRVYHKRDNGQPVLMRLAFNRWEMRLEERWKISRRESRVMGEEAAQNLLKESLSEF
jgi:ketosteroid isomerase-like protein